MTDIQNSSIASNNINANQHNLTNLQGIGFSSSDPTGSQMTIDASGNILWNNSTILTSFNSNIPAASQIFNAVNTNAIQITDNIPISCKVFKSTI